MVRADSGYCRDAIISLCEERGWHFVIGVARNSRLVKKIEAELAEVAEDSEKKGRPARRYASFRHSTLDSWSRERRVVAKAEHLPGADGGKPNPRFVVTSPPDSVSARSVHGRRYCPRGRAENVIKEQQTDLFGRRISASKMAANQLRLLFSAFAGHLIARVRRALRGTALDRAAASTIRLKLLRIGARATVSARRVRFRMDSGHPMRGVFAAAHARLRAPPTA